MDQAAVSFLLSIIALVISALALVATFWSALTSALNRRDKKRVSLTVVGRSVMTNGEGRPISEWTLHNAGEATLINPHVVIPDPDGEHLHHFLSAGTLGPGGSILLTPFAHPPSPEAPFSWMGSRATVVWREGRRDREAQATVNWDFR